MQPSGLAAANRSINPHNRSRSVPRSRSDNYLYAAPGYLAVSLFWGFLVVLEAVLVSMEVYSHRRWHVSASLKARVQWIWIFSSVFFVATIIVFSLKHYLPPLLMLFGVVLACITRLVIAGLGHAEHLIVSEERS